MGLRSHSDENDDEPTNLTHVQKREAFLAKAKQKRAKHNATPHRPFTGEHFGLLEEYAGVYGDYAYGNIEIAIDGSTEALTMIYGREQFV